MRLLLGVAASAAVLALVPQPASASHWFECSHDFEIVCTVAHVPCRKPFQC